MGILRTALYCRLSKDDMAQGDSESIKTQKAMLSQYAREHGFLVIETYVDEGITGCNTKKRDGFNKMVEDALSGAIDLIITKSVSRFARNTVDSLTTIRKLKENRVECYFEKKDFYTGKVPKNAVKWAFFRTLWCLVGV